VSPKDESGAVVAMPQALVELLLERLGAPAAAASGLTAEQLAEILKSTGLSTAAAMQSALKPENANHPGVSCYSYPEGDFVKPRPTLKCLMTWCSAEIDPETQHWYELELLNKAQPGEYVVTQADMGHTTLTIRPEADPTTGKLFKLHFSFPLKDGESKRVSPMSVWLLEAQGKSYMEAMTTWLQVMAADLAAKAAPVMVPA
jgi:hypothetical protein